MAATCKFYHKTSNAVIARAMKQIFIVHELEWDEIRLMLTHTDANISGLFANQAIFVERHPHGTASLVRMDIYVPSNHSHCVIKYFQVATKYSLRKTTRDPSHKIATTSELMNEDPERFPLIIHVHNVKAENPKLTVFRQPHTALFVTISGQGIFIPDTAGTLKGLSYANPRYLLLDNKSQLDEFKLLIQQLKAHKISMAPYHAEFGTPEMSICGRDVDCPSTFRYSGDRMADFAPFQEQVLGLSREVRGQQHGIHWSLGKAGCAKGHRAPPFYAMIYTLEGVKKDNTWTARYENALS
ncbi:hypothetical protein B0H13DRAFT_2356635 [Mycena leptocephala]|nr:hypothetical protein B0H13DRAFT_2356635 [Mycena leptocephala]